MVGRCRDCDLTWASFVVDSRPTSLSPTPPRTRPKPPWMESWAFRPVATCTALERFCGPGAWPGRPGPKHPPQSGERQPSRQLRVNEVSPSAPSHHHGCCPTGGQDEVQLGSRPSGIHPSGVVSSVSKQLNHRSNAQKIDGWESSVHPSAIRRLIPLLDNVHLVPLPGALLRIQSEAVCSPFLLCPWSRFLPCHQIPQPLTAQIFHALRTAPLSGTTGASLGVAGHEGVRQRPMRGSRLVRPSGTVKPRNGELGRNGEAVVTEGSNRRSKTHFSRLRSLSSPQS